MSTASSNTIIKGRYLLQKVLGKGGMGIVYRCTDRLNNTQLALKQVITSEEEDPDGDSKQPKTAPIGTDVTAQFSRMSTQSSVRLSLSQEFQTLASLRHPHIISVLDYGFDNQKQPFYTMPLLENASVLTDATANKPLSQRLALVADMLKALVYLHRRDIIHRDLKPDNVMVTADGRVKVLDFGLAVLRAQQQKSDDEDYIVGTVPYMAPELLRGEGASVVSDLYAVGMILYEVISGEHPFAGRNIGDVMLAILTEQPDIDALDVSEDLRDIVDRLVAFEPEDRFPNAQAALESLALATQQDVEIETEEVRDSFLQAARFVGRNTEIRTLYNGLIEATKGHGSSWLIGGESGVGKSRLVDELRVRALVNGVMVLRGQATSGGGLTFQLWRDPLRRLILSSDIDEQDGSILKPLIQDIELLVQRKIPTFSTKDSSNYLDQLKSVIAKLFQQVGYPIVLILEDLQWAEESLEILDVLNNMVNNLRLLIVATYRDNESASLPDKLPGMNVMKLSRLNHAELEELTQSIIGEQHHDKLIELLEQETEGNVLFMIEVLRSLAKSAGHISNITSMNLPRQISAEGIQEILSSRLTGLSAEELTLLRMLAITGREIDQALLQNMTNHQSLKLSVEDWMAKCLNRGIFSLQEETWRFSHDRLRSITLKDQSDKEKAQLHKQIAVNIEETYPDAHEQYAILQYHWLEAGDKEKGLTYSVSAGNYAMRLNAFLEASEHYERALRLLVEADDPAQQDMKTDVMLKLGEAQYESDNLKQAEKTLYDLLGEIQPEKQPASAANAQYWLANTMWRQSKYEQARLAATTSLEIAKELENKRLIGRNLERLAYIAFDVGNNQLARKYYTEGLTYIEEETSEERAAVLGGLGLVAWREEEFDEATRYMEQSLSIRRELGAQHKVVASLNNLGIVAGQQGNFDVSLPYFEDALALARSIGDRVGASQALNNLGFLHKLMGNFETARQYLLECLNLAQVVGNQYEIVLSTLNLGHVEVDMGNLADAKSYFVDCLQKGYAIDAIPQVTEAVLELAQLTDDMNTTLYYLSHVVENQATPSDVRSGAEKVIENILESMDEDEAKAIKKRGADADVKDVVESILAEFDNDDEAKGK